MLSIDLIIYRLILSSSTYLSQETYQQVLTHILIKASRSRAPGVLPYDGDFMPCSVDQQVHF